MKIYFAGSIRGGRGNIGLYIRIIDYLKKYGNVLTEHVGDRKITKNGEYKLNAREIYKRDVNWLKSCDVVIAEVSTPSLGVGFELAKAIELNKRILCLFNPHKGFSLSAMIKGCPRIINKDYKNFEEIKSVLDNFLKKK